MALGTIASDTIQDGAGNSISTTTIINGSAKAWVQYCPNPNAIAGSFNVSSVTYISAGGAEVNFTTAMPNTNYAATIAVTSDGALSTCYFNGTKTQAFYTTKVCIATAYSTGASTWAGSNPTAVCVSVFSS